MARHSAPWLHVQAWTGAPPVGPLAGDSDGVAVLGQYGVPRAIVVIPLHACGVRECGNAGVQLDADIPATRLEELVEVLSHLPWSDERWDADDVLKGPGIAGRESYQAGLTESGPIIRESPDFTG